MDGNLFTVKGEGDLEKALSLNACSPLVSLTLKSGVFKNEIEAKLTKNKERSERGNKIMGQQVRGRMRLRSMRIRIRIRIRNVDDSSR